MSKHKDIGSLINNRLFRGIETSKLKMKLRQNNFFTCREGDIIFQKGDASENIYMILEGEVKVKTQVPGTGSTIYRKGRDDFFGEIELFEKTPRMSSAIANMDCILYTLSRKEVYELVSANKTIKKNLSGEEENYTETKSSDEIPELSNEELTEEIIIEDKFENIDDGSLLDEELRKMHENNEEFELSNLDLNEGIELPEEEIIEGGIALTPAPNELSDNTGFTGKGLEEESEESIFSKALESDSDLNEYKSPDEIEFNHVEFSQEVETNEFIEPQIETPNEPLTVDYIDYKKIFQSAKKINSSNELEKTIRSAIEALIELFDAQIIRIFLAENSARELWSYPFMDNSEGIKKVKYGEGLIGSTAVERNLINLNEPLTDARFNTQIDSVPNIFIEDMILFPVFNDSQNLIAVVQMINSGKSGFNSKDIEIFSILSSNIASAIENSKSNPEIVKEDKLEETSAEQVNIMDEEYVYFSKVSEFLTGDIKISASLLLRYLDFIKRKGETEEIKNASSLALQEIKLILKNAGIVSDYINGKSALKKEILNFSKSIDEILYLLAEYVESRKFKLFKKCQADVSVNLDKEAFYIACYQIIKNACEVMQPGGTIYVTCTKEDKNIILEFKDNGPGISEDIKGKIFEPFFSFPGDKPGLGLAIANKIIIDHGGELKLNHEVTEGASFIINLPAVE